VLNKHDGSRHEYAQRFVAWLKGCADDYCGDGVAPHINEQLVVTILLGVVAFIFWFILRKGFNRNVLMMAVPLVGLYLLMTGILIAGGLCFLYQRPDIVTDWLDRVQRGQFDMPEFSQGAHGWGTIVLWSLLALPNLALGLSGFEMSMILMPQVRGKRGES